MVLPRRSYSKMKLKVVSLCITIMLMVLAVNGLKSKDNAMANQNLEIDVIWNNARLAKMDSVQFSQHEEEYFAKLSDQLGHLNLRGKGIRDMVKRFSRAIRRLEHKKEHLQQSTSHGNLEDCVARFKTVLSDASNLTLYAMKMLDSWGVPESGILEGNVRWPGHFHECKAAESEFISGKWCISYLGFQYDPFSGGYPVDLSLGSCFPSICSDESVQEILAEIYNMSTRIPILATKCPEPDTEISSAVIIGIVISTILLLFALLATIDDWMLRSKEDHVTKDLSKARKLLLCFSVISNGKKILGMTKKPGTLPALDGIRFISTTWVIIGHCLGFLTIGLDNTIYMANKIENDGSSLAITNGTFSVDTFFFLSGLLVAYLGMKHLSRTKGSMNVPLMYLQRYLRLTPAYAYMILFSVGLYKFLGAGPFWRENTDSFIETCKDDWWSNLLYINNFYPIYPECFGVGWYLADDMQFYILSPIFLLTLYRSKMLGLLLMFVVCGASMLTTGLLTYFSELQPHLVNIFHQLTVFARLNYWFTKDFEYTYNLKFQYDTYSAPWCRISVYMIGMVTGYLLHEYKGKIKMSKIVAIFGWLLSGAIACAIVYGLYPTIRVNAVLSVELSAFYEACSRPVWALCVAWVTVACVSGYGGPINTFLNWKVFIPLSRLTYTAYLIHILVIFWYTGSQDIPFHFSMPFAIFFYLGVLMITFGCAFIVSLFVEWPFLCMMKLIFPGQKSKVATKVVDMEKSLEMNGINGSDIKPCYWGNEKSDPNEVTGKSKDFEKSVETRGDSDERKKAFSNGGFVTETDQKTSL